MLKPDYDGNLIVKAKELRKNATPQENHLWYDFLRNYTPRFQRQRVIGSYIVDFYCSYVSLAVEIDGSQHYYDTGVLNDAKRTKALEKLGVTIIRFSNYEINTEFESVCEMIDYEVKKRL